MPQKSRMPPSSKTSKTVTTKENNKVAVSSFLMPSESETGNDSLLPDKAEWDASAIEPSNDCKPNGNEKQKPLGKNFKKIYLSNVIIMNGVCILPPSITFH